MIKVKINYQKGILSSIIASGHAMYSEYGKDIVCSATSSCIITTINGILKIDSSSISIDQKEDTIIVEVLKQNDIALKLLDNMIEMLEELEEQYPKNIRLSKEENE